MKKLLSLSLITSMVVLAGCSAKPLMVEERVSPYSVEDTVKKIQENAKSVGWVAPEVKNMNASIQKNGGSDIGGAVRIVELCNAHHAGKILRDDDGRYASLFMPCSIGVYEKKDGKTYVSSMKAGRLGAMMGGIVSDVMADVDVDQKKILQFLDQ